MSMAADLPKRSYKCGNPAAAAAMQLTRGWDAGRKEDYMYALTKPHIVHVSAVS
jgi:hypothetical protein